MSEKIVEIQIKNIKGIEDKTFNVDIFINKPNILVAPNGFGKSSLAFAFESLNSTRIQIDKENLFKKEETRTPYLSITTEYGHDKNKYEADNNKNNLNPHFSIFVLRNQTNVKAFGRNIGGQTVVSGNLSINDQLIVNTIPEVIAIPYGIAEMKRNFGNNGKVLPNISILLSNDEFIVTYNSLIEHFEKFNAQFRRAMIDNVITQIQQLNGNEEQVKAKYNDTWLDTLSGEDNYKEIQQKIQDQKILTFHTKCDWFLVFWQLYMIVCTNKTEIRNANKRAKYNQIKKRLTEGLALLNTSQWKAPEVHETSRKLIVQYPKAADLSYGQRDLLTFYPMLLKMYYNQVASKKVIMIIDEIFDYLDDANLLTVQYFINDYISLMKKTNGIYPIILTHLEPDIFKTFHFKKAKVSLLENVIAVPSVSMKDFLSKRDEPAVQGDISKYLLHYHTGTINRRADFDFLNFAKPSWGQGTIFFEYLINETNKYLRKESFYDPYAVCVCLRIRIEKLFYDQLTESDVKDVFLNTFETIPKLEYAERQLGEINDVYYILRPLFNDPCHFDGIHEKIVVFKLNNMVIFNILNNIFQYQGIDLSIDAIH